MNGDKKKKSVSAADQIASGGGSFRKAPGNVQWLDALDSCQRFRSKTEASEVQSLLI